MMGHASIVACSTYLLHPLGTVSVMCNRYLILAARAPARTCTWVRSKATAGQQQLGYDVSRVGRCLLLVAVSEAVEAQDPASTWALPTSLPFGLKHLHFSQTLG